MNPGQALTEYALSMLGVPYIWGGENRLTGVDCSGLVQLILRAGGVDPPGDQTAQALYDHFHRTSGVEGIPQWGALAFYGESVLKISHVAWCLNPYQMVHAAGGDSTCKTIEDAKKKGACVRIDLIDYRKDRVALIRPRYPKIGIVV